MIYTSDPDRIEPIEESEGEPEPDDLEDWIRDERRDKEANERR